MTQTQTPVKASLISKDGTDNIEFMFNPTQLTFNRTMGIQSSDARSTSGLPKVSFAGPNAYTLTINSILFDTYESGTSVMVHVGKLRQSVVFAGSLGRPPVYVFTWGTQQYLKCFVQSLSYKLTMFLPDGTPVRASADLTLQEIDNVTAK
jgi:Contractile injection system tube protein